MGTIVRRSRMLLIAFALMLLLAACSPEYTRTRGGGPGADVGNRVLGPSLDIHGPLDPSFGEPKIGKAVELENRR